MTRAAVYIKVIDTIVAVGFLFLGLAVFISLVSALAGLILTLPILIVGGAVRQYIVADVARLDELERERWVP